MENTLMPLPISNELRDAVQAASGKPVLLKDPATQEEYVVISAALFESLTSAFPGKVLTTDEQVQHLVATGLRVGWDDPELDIYNDVEPQS